MKEVSQTILSSIHDNKITWRKVLKMFKDINQRPTLGHIYLEHIYDILCHHNRVFYKLQSFIVAAGSCKALTHRVQVASGV
jgi:hypothetical protein